MVWVLNVPIVKISHFLLLATRLFLFVLVVKKVVIVFLFLGVCIHQLQKFFSENELVDFICAKLFVVIGLVLEIELHSRVHLEVLRPWILSVLTAVDVKSFPLFEILTNLEILLLYCNLDG